MPTYDLQCKDCEHKLTVFCSISAKDKQVCPQCGSNQLSQRFTSVNIGGGSSGNSSSSSAEKSSSGFG